MPYRVPGAYARFVKTASAVNNVGATRVLGLVGTGATWFEVYNEAVKKSDYRPYDLLKYDNVFEIISVTDRALSNGSVVTGSKIFEEGVAFELKDGNKISWNTITEPEVSVTTATPTEASIQLRSNIDAIIKVIILFEIQNYNTVVEEEYLERSIITFNNKNNTYFERLHKKFILTEPKLILYTIKEIIVNSEKANKKIEGNMHKITRKIYSLKSGAQCIVEVEDS